jgi:hypothetical protein
MIKPDNTMLKKYRMVGNALPKEKLKHLVGGTESAVNKIYTCTDGFTTGTYCSSYDPGPICGFTCTAGGPCAKVTFTGSNCF